MLKFCKMHRSLSFVFLCCHCCCCFFDTIIKCNMVFMNEKWNKEIKRKNGKRDGLSHTLIKIRNCCHRHQHQFAFHFYFGCGFLLAISIVHDCFYCFTLFCVCVFICFGFFVVLFLFPLVLLALGFLGVIFYFSRQQYQAHS